MTRFSLSVKIPVQFFQFISSHGKKMTRLLQISPNLYAVLEKRAFCRYLGRSREAASGAVFECSLGNLRAAKRLRGGFGHTSGAVFYTSGADFK